MVKDNLDSQKLIPKDYLGYFIKNVVGLIYCSKVKQWFSGKSCEFAYLCELWFKLILINVLDEK